MNSNKSKIERGEPASGGMISRDEVKKLADLSRLMLSDEEISLMQHDMTSILAYVNKLKSAEGIGRGPAMSVNKNVLREDVSPHGGGVYTDGLISSAPKHVENKDGKYVKVKKIL